MIVNSTRDPRVLVAAGIALVAMVAAAVLATPAAADPATESLYTKPDRAWISLTGEVADSDFERFVLDHGEGLVTVEMDDWDWYDEANRIMAGDRVTVYGRIDAGLYEKRTIEAESVYVFDRNTYYYASDADEEGDYLHSYGIHAHSMPEGSWMSLTGRVRTLSGREFTLDTGAGMVQVDTISMAYNPLDDVGFQQIDAGDRVTVTGHLDLDFFERREIMAETIVSLTRDETKMTEPRGATD